MYTKQLKTILYEYANAHGLGMPLTAEQCLNAMSGWLIDTLPDCIDVKIVVIDSGAEADVTLTGAGLPEDHYVFTFYIPKGEKGDAGVGIDTVELLEISN